MDYAESFAERGEEDDLFRLDGVIGQDILQQGVLRLDFPNRRYHFQRKPREK
jgi:hypothetical protein